MNPRAQRAFCTLVQAQDAHSLDEFIFTSCKRRRWSAIAIALCAAFASRLSSAQDRFEIQVYDSETAAPLTIGLETHLNYTAEGTHEPSAEGELPTHHMARFTVEPHLGLTSWSELGAYFQTALRSDGTYDFAGVKLRFKAKYPDKLATWIGLAVNVEISSIPRVYEANRFGSEIRPIADLHWQRLYVSVNPILSIDLSGALAWHPQLQPAAKLGLDLWSWLQVGTEYYSGLGPIGGSATSVDQTHTLFGIIDFTSDYFDVNFGVGYGLAGPDRWVVKTILTLHPKPEHR